MFERDVGKECLYSKSTKVETREENCAMALTDIIKILDGTGIEVVVLDGSGELAYFPQLKLLYLHQETSLEKVEIIIEYILNRTPNFTPNL